MSSLTTEITMPQMGVSVAEGTVVDWKKQVGDWVEADEVIAGISTDKIDTDVEAPAAGRLQEILVQVGETVDVGVVLALIATDAKPGEAHSSEGTSEAAVALEAPGEAGELQGDTAATPRTARLRRAPPGVPAGGGTRRSSCGSRPSTTSTSRASRGPAAAGACASRTCSRSSSPAEPAPDEPPMHIESPYRPDEPVAPKKRVPRFERPRRRPRRRAAARCRACGSRSAARWSSRCTPPRRAPRSSRRTCPASTRRGALGVTFLPIVARATIETLREFPALNATLEGDTLTTFDGVHLGVAVSLGEGGLIVPVIRDAQELSVEGLAARIKDMARRARSNELTPDEVRGGSFTITNPGGYGSIIATPVINQPQVAILDTEAVVKRPVVVTDELGNDSIAIRHMTYLCMSWDHRALDGALAARFLRALADRLEAWPV